MSLSATPSLPLTIERAAAELRCGTISSSDLVVASLAAIDRRNDELGAILSRFDETALEAAGRADARLRSGDPVSPLCGIPIVVKDILDTDEEPASAQSLVPSAGTAQGGDAEAVARLRSAGAVIVGKASTMEFAIGTPDPSKPFANPVNPWSESHWAGGSSSGTASAVSAGLALGGIGTDTGGSIRMPSAFCGTTGLKPTYGLVSRRGCIPLAYSLDHVGPMARSARDCALMLNLMAAYDRGDPASVAVEARDYVPQLDRDLSGIRIGVDPRSREVPDGADAQIVAGFEQAVLRLSDLGAAIVEVTLPYREELTIAHGVILDCEALSYHLPNLRSRWADFTRSTRLRVASGCFYTAADYLQAQRARRLARTALERVFTMVDVMVSPFSAVSAIATQDLGVRLDPWIRYMDAGYWDAAGNPALVVPLGFASDDLPAGMQITARPGADGTVLRVGDAFQQVTDWHLQVPEPFHPDRL